MIRARWYEKSAPIAHEESREDQQQAGEDRQPPAEDDGERAQPPVRGPRFRVDANLGRWHRAYDPSVLDA